MWGGVNRENTVFKVTQRRKEELKPVFHLANLFASLLWKWSTPFHLLFLCFNLAKLKIC